MFFFKAYDSVSPTKKHREVEQFLSSVKQAQSKLYISALNVNVQNEALKPSLRNYQKNAVLWMLYKEGFSRAVSVSQGKNTPQINKIAVSLDCIILLQTYFILCTKRSY